MAEGTRTKSLEEAFKRLEAQFLSTITDSRQQNDETLLRFDELQTRIEEDRTHAAEKQSELNAKIDNFQLKNDERFETLSMFMRNISRDLDVLHGRGASSSDDRSPQSAHRNRVPTFNPPNQDPIRNRSSEAFDRAFQPGDNLQTELNPQFRPPILTPVGDNVQRTSGRGNCEHQGPFRAPITNQPQQLRISTNSTEGLKNSLLPGEPNSWEDSYKANCQKRKLSSELILQTFQQIRAGFQEWREEIEISTHENVPGNDLQIDQEPPWGSSNMVENTSLQDQEIAEFPTSGELVESAPTMNAKDALHLFVEMPKRILDGSALSQVIPGPLIAFYEIASVNVGGVVDDSLDSIEIWLRNSGSKLMEIVVHAQELFAKRSAEKLSTFGVCVELFGSVEHSYGSVDGSDSFVFDPGTSRVLSWYYHRLEGLHILIFDPGGSEIVSLVRAKCAASLCRAEAILSREANEIE